MSIDTSDIKNIPQHVALIVDGNRRWAKRRSLPTLEGHRRGVDNVEKIFDLGRSMGIKYMTAWVFSTDNWNRDPAEVKYLFELFREHIKKYRKKFMKEEIRFIHLGRKDRVDEDIRELIEALEEDTKDFTNQTICLALDYGGRDDLIRATKKIVENGEEITEENIDKNLDTADVPNPDLIIRTSGELRMSGFLSWQSSYSEFAFPETPFPAFKEELFVEAIRNYSERDRRFGGNSKNEKKYLKK
ncbi:di-trans,poly-cis-decaprenylcistransferase [candidate division WWE3 bacterium]|jgi:undecaprenyl diphosphate synthase|nr:di-trans,poly-cis-decaprenylcistransferase [candidate division WWE3 bacterium]MBT7350245.1 di-trans,poly-cis-decaprenylcistransferase [candidate division WWE3 bacterium]